MNRLTAWSVTRSSRLLCWSIMPDMTYFPAEVLVALVIACAVGILAILHVLAVQLRREVQLHDLRVRTVQLRNSYTQRMDDMHARESGGAVEVIEVGDEATVAGQIEPAPSNDVAQAA